MNPTIKAIEEALHVYAGFPYMRSILHKEITAKHINLLCIGKSAYPMAKAATEALAQAGIDYSGYLLTKYHHAPQCISKLKTLEAGHPLPDQNSLKHSTQIMAWLKSLSPESVLLILLSGGGSALFEIPSETYSLEDIVTAYKRFLHSGISIAEINEQRKAMSRVKQGKALTATKARKVLCLALSDVASNDPAIIASAPFYTPFAERISPNHYRYVNPKEHQELDYHIIGDNLLLLNTIVPFLTREAFVHQPYCSMKAGDFAAYLADFALTNPDGAFHLWGGETPLKVRGDGFGGRCTHVALDFATRIAGHQGISLTCFASDGSDNLDGVAGACVDGSTIGKLKAKGIDAQSHLNRCDSYTALKAIGATIPALSQRINVNDVFILQNT